MPPKGVQVILKPFKRKIQNFAQKSNWNFVFLLILEEFGKIIKKNQCRPLDFFRATGNIYE
jgi:hypothetical protein